MGKAVIRGGIDAFVMLGRPNKSFPVTPYLRLRNGITETFIYLRNPAPRGATILSAKLRLVVHSSNGQARTLTMRRVAEPWAARRVTWSNRPSLKGVTRTYDLPAGHSRGHVVEFDVTQHIQTVTNGDDHYGWKIVSSHANDLLRLFSFQAARNKPTLEVEWADEPDAPTSMTPSEGAVSVSHPTLQFDYTDVSGNTELAAVQVQIDPNENGSSPAWDSGRVPSREPELVLSDTTFPGVAVGATTYWRVRVQDGAGLWSGWSDWAPLTRRAKGTVTILNPPNVAQPYVTEPTPPIAWSFSATQTAWQVRITPKGDRGNVLWGTGKRQGTDNSVTIPEGVLVDDSEYSVNVRVWDDVDRDATPGDPIFSWAWRDFVMDDDAAVPGSETFSAQVVGDTPWVDLTWTRGTMPDDFAIYRDGKVLKMLDPVDVLVSGTTYRWRDMSADPHREHVWSVRAVVNGSQSTVGRTVRALTSPVGVWLVDEERDLTVVLAGDDEGTWDMPDDASVYTPVGSDEVVRIVGGLRGYEGSLTGLLIDGFHGRTVEAQEDALWEIKARPSRSVRLIAGDVNTNVILGNVSVAPSPATRNGDIVKRVSFDFWQVGELPFVPRL